MTFYEDKRGKWRWRLVGVNYEIIGCSSQGFATRAKATENARLVARALIQYGFHV